MRLFVDNLVNLDFSYFDHKRGLVGETWLASVELEGTLDEQGMICDFGIVKKTLRQWLEKHIDHCLLVPALSSHVEHDVNNGEASAKINLANGEYIICRSPEQAITPTATRDISPSDVAEWCISQLEPLFPQSVSSLSLYFKPETIPGDYYHYSHGLKKHDGNCQRIAHGHRSKIEIFLDGCYAEKEMNRWSTVWKDIYIGSHEDLVESHKQSGVYVFEYSAEQGAFYLEIPKSRCYLIQSDTTVELIAQHIASTLKAEQPSKRYIVKAYEGLAKGAIVTT